MINPTIPVTGIPNPNTCGLADSSDEYDMTQVKTAQKLHNIDYNIVGPGIIYCNCCDVNEKESVRDPPLNPKVI